MHAFFLCEQTHILAQLGQIRNIKVSMESGEYIGPIWVQNVTWAHKQACMHAVFLHA